MDARGFSLVEVLVFVSVLSVFFVVAAFVSVFSLRALKSNENRILATRYSEEALEWVRGEKEDDWQIFSTTRLGNWCFNTVPVSSWPAQQGVCTTYGISNVWKRDVTIAAGADDTQVNITIITTWQEAGNTFTVPLKTVLSRFE